MVHRCTSVLKGLSNKNVFIILKKQEFLHRKKIKKIECNDTFQISILKNLCFKRNVSRINDYFIVLGSFHKSVNYLKCLHVSKTM